MGAKAGVGALGLVLLAILVFLAVSSWSRQPAGAKPSIQPINFPHRVHVQTYKIDCQYCHSDARRSEYAGLPSVQRCMGCHRIAGAALPEVKKVADYYARGEPIPWVRVNKLPEFTYFPHKAHIRASRRAPASAAAAHDGLVPRLPPAAERDGGRARAARLRHVPPLSQPRRSPTCLSRATPGATRARALER
ncbi:MAG: hypothetical protein AUH20_03085 [Candidatus Rokubacteria bacterium 13_2_20CM_69_15_2]|nr:MAG: hypothetical protein AUH20_03085 [Candidatus Rokubacteria bacterium 13_2_20CM_69_15_2]